MYYIYAYFKELVDGSKDGAESLGLISTGPSGYDKGPVVSVEGLTFCSAIGGYFVAYFAVCAFRN